MDVTHLAAHISLLRPVRRKGGREGEQGVEEGEGVKREGWGEGGV